MKREYRIKSGEKNGGKEQPVCNKRREAEPRERKRGQRGKRDDRCQISGGKERKRRGGGDAEMWEL